MTIGMRERRDWVSDIGYSVWRIACHRGAVDPSTQYLNIQYLLSPLPQPLSRRSPDDVSGAAFVVPHDVRWWRTGKASADLSIFPLARARVRSPLRTTTFSSSTAPPLAGAVQALRHGIAWGSWDSQDSAISDLREQVSPIIKGCGKGCKLLDDNTCERCYPTRGRSRSGSRSISGARCR
jgi:hypothetical protein